VLIKIAATWEGIQAAAALERDGIHCNLTLLFAPIQAAACARAGVRLISPFRRPYLRLVQENGRGQLGRSRAGVNDPGVRSVRRIYACCASTALPPR
jgi:transaldolase